MYGNKITDESKELIGNRGSKTPLSRNVGMRPSLIDHYANEMQLGVELPQLAQQNYKLSEPQAAGWTSLYIYNEGTLVRVSERICVKEQRVDGYTEINEKFFIKKFL